MVGVGGVDGQRGGLGVAGVEGGGHGVPVPGPVQGPPEGGVGAGPLPAVVAHKDHGGGGVVPHGVVPGKAQGAGAGEVGGDQGDVPGVKGVDEVVGGLDGDQGDGLQGQVIALPPVAPGGQHLPLLPLDQAVGTCPRRDALGAGLDDGDVQQGGQGSVGAGEDHLHRPLQGGDRLHLGQPPGKPGLSAPGQLQGGGRVGGGEGGAVGEGDSRPEDEGPGEAVLTDGVALAQQRLGGEALVQSEQPLPDETGEGGVHLVHPQDGVEGPGGPGKGEGRGAAGAGRGRGGRRGGGLRRRRAAAGEQKERQEQGGQTVWFHRRLPIMERF